MTGGPEDVALRRRMAAELPDGLVAHIDRVVSLTDRLATLHGLDVGLARLMAQGHDLVRAIPPAELVKRAVAQGLTVDPVERDVPVILHGPLGALELSERFGVTDQRVLDAIWWHTTGHPEYGSEAWAMFVADKVEPHKVERWPALQSVLDAALDTDGQAASLERAALLYLDLRQDEAVRDRLQVHPMATLTRNYLLRHIR
ncbi:MAG: HD domain-containing protein [Chloroflexi bacterium]|nr:HD domain-containing protein [Chloroflexota bacterium]